MKTNIESWLDYYYERADLGEITDETAHLHYYNFRRVCDYANSHGFDSETDIYLDEKMSKILNTIRNDPDLINSSDNKHRWFARTLINYREWIMKNSGISRIPENEITITKSNPVTIPFTNDLSKIFIPQNLGTPKTPYGWDVLYEPGIPSHETIPWLIEFINLKLEFICTFFSYLHLGSIDSGYHLRIILSDKKVINTYRKDPDPEALGKLLSKYDSLGVNAVPIPEIRKAISPEIISDVLAGEYIHGSGGSTIYIYYRILNAADNFKYLAEIRMILSHEIFHALHDIK